MNIHHNMRRLGSLLIAMQLMAACSFTSAKEQEAAEAFKAFTANPSAKGDGVLECSLSVDFRVEKRGDYMVINVPTYHIVVVDGYDGSGHIVHGPDTPPPKFYYPEETGPMLFVYRDGKLYAASEPARMYAPDLEYFELPQEAIGQ